MREIGILTFSNANNIGALLQAYALQQYLSKFNSVEHIDFRYTSKSGLTQQMKKGYNTYAEKIKKLRNLRTELISREKRKKLDMFRKSYIKFGDNTYTDRIDTPPNYDVYIVGSDQVWNTDLNGCKDAFYLPFVQQGKKIAYAGSVGRTLTEEDKKYLAENIGTFDYVSVRENDLNDYIVNQLGVNSEVVLDPVFLLTKSEWLSIEKSVNVPDSYVFVYLMEDNETIRKVAEKAATKYEARIIWLQGGEKCSFIGKQIPAASPNEFIYLISHAKCVITNSFHGSAFSIILEKPLCMVQHSTRNARLLQLSDIVDSTVKIVKLSEENIRVEENIVDNVNEKLLVYIDNSKMFLEKSLR